MKQYKFCTGCVTIQHIPYGIRGFESGVRVSCGLGYKTDIRENGLVPSTPCPKPMSYKNYEEIRIKMFNEKSS